MRDQYINAHVPFDPSNEQGLGDVLLDYALLCVLQFHHIVDQGDASAFRTVCRLTDPFLVFVTVECVHKLIVLVGQDVGLGDKVVSFAEK